MVERSSCNEAERHVKIEELALQYHLYGWAPVQADGTVSGRPFYFRARHAFWKFIVCINADVDPSFISPSAEQETGFFQDREYIRYEMSGDYGTGSDASYMPYDVASELIMRAAKQFLADSKLGLESNQ